MSTINTESHLEQRFRRIWASVAPDLKIEAQIKGVVPGRRYVYDFLQPESKVLFEINGGSWSKGKSGHSSGKGIARDGDKVNLAQVNGYYIIVLTNEKLTTEYIDFIADFCRTLIAIDQAVHI